MSPRHKQSDPSIIKSSVIRLRVTEAEAECFKANAINAGCKSISEYIRMKCISEDGEDTGVDTVSDKTDKSSVVKKAKKKPSE